MQYKKGHNDYVVSFFVPVECEDEDENFCTDSRLKSYATVMKERKPNFSGNQIIYIFETNVTEYVNKKPYRLVVIDPTKKTVMPFVYTLSGASDYSGNVLAVNNKGETMYYDFNIKSSRFCFSGNIDAYRISDKYVDEPFYFKYDKAQKYMMREY